MTIDESPMGNGDQFIFELKKSFWGWDFLALNSEGFSGGLITGWNHNVSLINSFSVHLGHCTVVYSKSLSLNLTLLNVYGPQEGLLLSVLKLIT
jgi:hypothetical protein